MMNDTTKVKTKTLLSGVQPTGKLTLGNYLGALKNWVDLQDEYECFFAAVNLHAITLRQDPAELERNTWYFLAVCIASGISPERAALFIQSQVVEHTQLQWVLTCNSYMGELSRMTQFKDKSHKAGKNIPSGLFVYPTLMAADILLYDAHLVPVGADQKQHLELTRDLAMRMNNLYGEDTFIVPEPYIAPIGAKIMDLQDPTCKMSKSAENENGTIFLNDSPKTIEKKLKRAVTDSGSELKETGNGEWVSNLLDIQSALTKRKPEDILHDYIGKQYGFLKVDTARIVVETLQPLQVEIERLMSDPGELQKIAKIGAERARDRASTVVARVYRKLGFAS